jgi:hypothetical protein
VADTRIGVSGTAVGDSGMGVSVSVGDGVSVFERDVL